MRYEQNAYLPYIHEKYDEPVVRDTGRQVIHKDVLDRFVQMQSASTYPLTFADMSYGTDQFAEQLQGALPDSYVINADDSNDHLTIAAFLKAGLPLPSNSIDAIASNFVFSELPHIGDVLKEYYRVLKEDGVIAVSMTNPRSDKIIAETQPEKIEGIRTDAQAAGTYLLGDTNEVLHFYRPFSKIVAAFHANGFRLTALDIVRFFSQSTPEMLPLPLPEYLILYGRKDTRRHFGLGNLRRHNEHASTQMDRVETVVYSTNPPEEFLRVVGNTPI